jgi:hypothetical protein
MIRNLSYYGIKKLSAIKLSIKHVPKRFTTHGCPKIPNKYVETHRHIRNSKLLDDF